MQCLNTTLTELTKMKVMAMNRADRRKIGSINYPKGMVNPNKETIRLSEDSFNNLVNEHAARLSKLHMDEVLNNATKVVMAAVVIQLNAEFGFGVKRIQKVLDGVNATFESMEEGLTTLEEIVKYADDLGVKIVRTKEEQESE